MSLLLQIHNTLTQHNWT